MNLERLQAEQLLNIEYKNFITHERNRRNPNPRRNTQKSRPLNSSVYNTACRVVVVTLVLPDLLCPGEVMETPWLGKYEYIGNA